MKMPGVHPVCRGDRRTASVDVTDARNAGRREGVGGERFAWRSNRRPDAQGAELPQGWPQYNRAFGRRIRVAEVQKCPASTAMRRTQSSTAMSSPISLFGTVGAIPSDKHCFTPGIGKNTRDE